MIRSAYGTEAPPAGETSRLDLRAYDAVLRLLDELDGFAALGGEASRRRRARCARAWRRCGSRAAGDAGRVAVLDLMRARTRQFEVVFLLGLEEGVLPRRQRVSPFLDDDARRDARRAGSSGPTRSAATATSSIRPARARPGASISFVRPRPTRAGRASRARSGTRSRRCSTPRTSAERRHGDRCRRSRGRSRRADRPRAAARAWRGSSPTDSRRRPCDRRRERLGTAARRVRARRSTGGRGSTNPAVLAWLGEDDVRRHRARAIRRLLVGLAVRAHRLAEDDRRRRRPDASRLGRPQRPAQVLRRAPEGARPRPGHAGERRAGGRIPARAASTTRCAAAFGST